MPNIKVKVLSNIPGYQKGQIETVETDINGTPLLRSWRRRLEEAKIDNCVEIINDPPPQKPQKKPKSNVEEKAK